MEYTWGVVMYNLPRSNTRHIYKMIGKCLGLIVIVAFSHKTTHSGQIEMLSLRGEQCIDGLHNYYL